MYIVSIFRQPLSQNESVFHGGILSCRTKNVATVCSMFVRCKHPTMFHSLLTPSSIISISLHVLASYPQSFSDFVPHWTSTRSSKPIQCFFIVSYPPILSAFHSFHLNSIFHKFFFNFSILIHFNKIMQSTTCFSLVNNVFNSSVS